MQLRNRWLIGVLVIAGLQLSACGQKPEKHSKVQPAKVEPVQGTDLKRVTLTEKAAERLDIKTAPLRQARVARTWTVGGEVARLPGAAAADRGKVAVRVRLSVGEAKRVEGGKTARILPLAQTGGAPPLTAQPLEIPKKDDDDDMDDRFKKTTATFYYHLDGQPHNLRLGQRVRVELDLSGSGTQRKLIPYAAVLYDTRGGTWVYTNPEPLVFVRQRINVDYIDGEQAVLSDGPAPGTAVVTAGGAELFGTELGIGK